MKRYGNLRGERISCLEIESSLREVNGFWGDQKASRHWNHRETVAQRFQESLEV